MQCAFTVEKYQFICRIIFTRLLIIYCTLPEDTPDISGSAYDSCRRHGVKCVTSRNCHKKLMRTHIAYYDIWLKYVIFHYYTAVIWMCDYIRMFGWTFRFAPGDSVPENEEMLLFDDWSCFVLLSDKCRQMHVRIKALLPILQKQNITVKLLAESTP